MDRAQRTNLEEENRKLLREMEEAVMKIFSIISFFFNIKKIFVYAKTRKMDQVISNYEEENEAR